MSKTIFIGGRLESKEKGNVVTGANAILDDTKGKKQNVINKETDDELLRLEQSKQDNLNFDNAPTEDSTNPVTSGGVYTAEKALSDAIEAILLLIPSAATALNKLIDTNTMNSSISTATATFRGTYNAVSDLGLTYQATHAQIEAALDALGLTADNNDFAFVQIPVSDQSQDIAKTERFKFNGTNWLYEYDLNTSGFTAAQWAAINSGITVALVTKLTDLPTAAALQLALNAKQDTLTFDNEPTALSQNPVTSGGIYTAIQAVATALSDYSTTTDGRLNVLEGLIPTEASSSNKLTDKAYVDGLIQAITELIPAEADTTNQLADKAYVLAQILAATPAFKGQFVTLAELQAVASPKAGDLGIVRTKDSDGMDVFTVYQYLNNAWNVFYSLSYHPQTKPATTGTTGDYPYNGMGRVELAKNMVNTGTELAPVMVNQLTQDMFYKGAVGSRVPNTNTIFVIRNDYVLAENITIPDNCVLEFEGGSISGAFTITGQETSIESPRKFIFDGVILQGTFTNNELYTSWFGITNVAADATSNSTKMNTYLIPSCANTGCDLVVDTEIYINSAFSINSYLFNLKCLKRIYYNGTQDYNGGVIAIENQGNWYVVRHHVINIENVNTAGDLATRKAYGICGVTINNLSYASVDVDFVSGFTFGCVVCSSIGSYGNAGNKYNLYHIHNCYKGLVLRATGSGWVNENIFNGGEIRCDSDCVFAAERIGIAFENNKESGYASFNNNVFFKPDFEASTIGIQVSANTMVEDGKFISVRDESVTTLIEDNGTDRDIRHKSIITPYYYQEKYRNMMTKNFFVKYDFDVTREFDIPLEGVLTGTTELSCLKGAHLRQRGDNSKFIVENSISIDGITDNTYVNLKSYGSLIGFAFLNDTGRFSGILRLKGKPSTDCAAKIFLIDDTGAVITSTPNIKTNMNNAGNDGWNISTFTIPETGILDYSMWMEDIPSTVKKIIVVGFGVLESISLITYGVNSNCYNENKVLVGDGTSTLFKIPESDYSGYGYGYFPAINKTSGKPMWRINAQWVDATGATV